MTAYILSSQLGVTKAEVMDAEKNPYSHGLWMTLLLALEINAVLILFSVIESRIGSRVISDLFAAAASLNTAAAASRIGAYLLRHSKWKKLKKLYTENPAMVDLHEVESVHESKNRLESRKRE